MVGAGVGVACVTGLQPSSPNGVRASGWDFVRPSWGCQSATPAVEGKSPEGEGYAFLSSEPVLPAWKRMSRLHTVECSERLISLI